ncbi:ArsR family transcriptional regulator [Promicromonospora sp. AC04]|uniref:ArsR/SmtB family transcription factor n=1 Tax=Promicromonospora sp. AC04 TaxID=2135723 RepID=UPI000D3B1384|nr:helix-turn-helix domain-containing protein [Promicromonospora sp. AC04]PUB22207.1 ArsR family transcriptional regulator [Promicromonospora sp. AC04]
MATARKDSPGRPAEEDAPSPSGPQAPRAAPSPSEPPAVGPPAELGPAALRALAHPLRIRILDLLPSRGPLTASKLGEIVGESSGSTSYHLRQLAKHGLVREVEGKGTARERWWERTPGGFSISNAGKDSPAGRQTAEAVNIEFLRLRHERVMAFIRAGQDADEETLKAWLGTAAFVTSNKWATPEQMKAIVEAWDRFAAEHIDPLSRQEGVPGAVPFEVHFDAFPTVDAEGNPL